MIAQTPVDARKLEPFYDQLKGQRLQPLWLAAEQGREAKAEPKADVRPWLWHWRELRASLLQAAELMPVGGANAAERRVLIMNNPSLPRATTRTLLASVQMIQPGEEAPSHRHTAAALRFIIEGSGAHTVVEVSRSRCSQAISC